MKKNEAYIKVRDYLLFRKWKKIPKSFKLFLQPSASDKLIVSSINFMGTSRSLYCYNWNNRWVQIKFMGTSRSLHCYNWTNLWVQLIFGELTKRVESILLGTLVERFPRGVFKKKKIVIANLFLGTSGNIGLVGFVLFGYCEQTTYLLYESQFLWEL